jgi:hypothetical protein
MQVLIGHMKIAFIGLCSFLLAEQVHASSQEAQQGTRCHRL